jgi:hypothetical protein
MNEQEYRVMYAEYCTDGLFAMSSEGFAEFVTWRKRVEKYFDNSSDFFLTIPFEYGIVRYNEK